MSMKKSIVSHCQWAGAADCKEFCNSKNAPFFSIRSSLYNRVHPSDVTLHIQYYSLQCYSLIVQFSGNIFNNIMVVKYLGEMSLKCQRNIGNSLCQKMRIPKLCVIEENNYQGDDVHANRNKID